MVIIFQLFSRGVLRFSELERATPGVSQKMLIQQLRELERDGIVNRTVYPQVLPKVEYEFTVGMDFNKVSGNRITLADIEGPHGAKETLARYRVGTSVPVYYDPANPRESVLDREPPPFFNVVWIVVAVLTAAILGGFYWFAWR